MPPTGLSHKGEAVEEWVDLHFFRPVGMRVVQALAPTRVSADQVTVAALVIGLLAGHLFLYDSTLLNALGLLLFIVSDVFDSADGQLARLRGNSTRFGRILDGISDNARFVNLYAHLLARLLLSHAMAPLGAVTLTPAAT
jgi:phosphatidylglycerophosphate synthase